MHWAASDVAGELVLTVWRPVLTTLPQVHTDMRATLKQIIENGDDVRTLNMNDPDTGRLWDRQQQADDTLLEFVFSVMAEFRSHINESDFAGLGRCGFVLPPCPPAPLGRAAVKGSCVVSVGGKTGSACACVGLHFAWAARGQRWPVLPESHAGDLRPPVRSAAALWGKVLRVRGRQYVDALQSLILMGSQSGGERGSW